MAPKAKKNTAGMKHKAARKLKSPAAKRVRTQNSKPAVQANEHTATTEAAELLLQLSKPLKTPEEIIQAAQQFAKLHMEEGRAMTPKELQAKKEEYKNQFDAFENAYQKFNMDFIAEAKKDAKALAEQHAYEGKKYIASREADKPKFAAALEKYKPPVFNAFFYPAYQAESTSAREKFAAIKLAEEKLAVAQAIKQAFCAKNELNFTDTAIAQEMRALKYPEVYKEKLQQMFKTAKAQREKTKKHGIALAQTKDDFSDSEDSEFQLDKIFCGEIPWQKLYSYCQLIFNLYKTAIKLSRTYHDIAQLPTNEADFFIEYRDTYGAEFDFFYKILQVNVIKHTLHNQKNLHETLKNAGLDEFHSYVLNTNSSPPEELPPLFTFFTPPSLNAQPISATTPLPPIYRL